MAEDILKTENLTKVYGKNKVVNKVCMHVKKGDIYGFIGENGAGKTTFMRMVAGLAAPTEGTLELFGSTDLEKQRLRMGSLIEEPGIYVGMTAEQMLEVTRRTLGITDRQAVKDLINFVGLSDTGKKKLKNFSMGMKQRLGIAIALMRDPDFLILDEPINGLDPSGIREIRGLLLRLNKEKNITILVSSHILGELSKIATRYGIIKNGVLMEEFTAEELKGRCRRSHKLVVSDTEKAVNILEEKLKIREFEVLDSDTIRIFEHLEETDQINRELVLGGVDIRESRMTGQDLEGYFMDLQGGAENV